MTKKDGISKIGINGELSTACHRLFGHFMIFFLQTGRQGNIKS